MQTTAGIAPTGFHPGVEVREVLYDNRRAGRHSHEDALGEHVIAVVSEPEGPAREAATHPTSPGATLACAI